MPRKTARRPKPYKIANKDIIKEQRAHARYMLTPMRPIKDHADEKAREYADWLLKRDGIDVAALAAAKREAHNAALPRRRVRGIEIVDGAIREAAELEARVEWYSCAAGRRPRFVHYRFAHPNISVLKFELPHWWVEIETEALAEAA